MRHDRPDEAYRHLATDLPFCSLELGGWGGGCTLVDPSWLVTAAHAASRLEPGGPVEVDGRRATIAEVIVHPDFDITNYRNDIALIRLSAPLRGAEVVQLHGGRDESGSTAIFVGRGYSGTGRSGAIEPDKVVRGAENRVDATTDHWLRFVFDAPPAGLDLEGISGPGDSGGPALLRIDNGWSLIGISSWQHQGEAEIGGVYGVTEYYTRVSSYVEWIVETLEHRQLGSP